MIRKLFTLFLILAIGINRANSQATFYTSGKYLLDECADTVLLRGIDYAPYNWGYDSGSNEIPQIEQTGANCARLVWYANGSAPYYTAELLDSVLTRSYHNFLIPVLELHDQTCDDNTAALIELANWYTSDSVQPILQRHQSHLIVNIANEALDHQWAPDPAAAAQTYVNTYNTIIGNLRAANLNFPLMIDAPDCGTDISFFTTVADSIRNADPKHNILFSAHAYWYAYANNDSSQMDALISAASNLDVPVLLGEFANYQDDTVACQWPLNYPALLHICQRYRFPWLCWSWDNDVCAARQLSNDGTFANLSPYGNDIINNPGYGIKNNAVRSLYMLNQGVCVATGLPEINPVERTLICRQVSEGVLGIRSIVSQQVQVMDVSGREIYSGLLNTSQQISLQLPAGMYLVISDKQAPVKAMVY